MKKIVKRIIVIFLILLFLQFILFLFKTEHQIKYEIKNGKEVFKIEETYDNSIYYFKVIWNGKNFSFYDNNNYHKRKKIVENIEFYKSGDLMCVYPALENTNIQCYKNSKLVSYYLVKNSINNFVNSLKEKGYNNNSWNETKVNTKSLGQLKIDYNAIEDNTYMYIWNYKGFYAVNKQELEIVRAFTNDTYVNNLGVLVDNYYVVANYDQSYDFDKIYVYNLKNNKKKVIKLKKTISRDSYILGVVDGLIYIFDKDSLIEYEINPKRRKVVEIGNKNDGGKFFDGKKFENVNIYDFDKDEELYFKDETSYIDDVIDSTTLKYINKNKELYYYLDKNNNFYLFNSKTKIKKLLFKDTINNIYMIDNDIYFIKDNILYQYLEDGIIKELLKYDELAFNSINRIAIYKK